MAIERALALGFLIVASLALLVAVRPWVRRRARQRG